MALPSSYSVAGASVSRSKAREHDQNPAHETLSDRDPVSVLSSSLAASSLRASRTETSSAADKMLRASFSGDDPVPASSASVSRSMLRGDKTPLATQTPRASVSRSVPSSAPSASVSRSTLRDVEILTTGDAPRAPLLDLTASSPSPASVSRSLLRGEVKTSKTDTLRRSFAVARGMPVNSSSTILTTPPPLYSSRLRDSHLPTSATADQSTFIDSVKVRKAQLQEETRRANAEASRRKTAGLFREACSTDLLFLIDTTSSMAPYLETAKDQIRDIVSDIKSTFLNEAQVRIAVVSYKDHGDHRNIEFLDFTPSVDAVRSFLGTLNANGGADIPEDVLGGISQALELTWKQQTRCIVHISDAPPHGSSNHDLGEYSDSYFREGSEPHGLTYQPLFRRLVQLKINYALLRINYSTDRMALNFADIYGYDNSKLHNTNQYYDQANRGKSVDWASLKPAQATQPQFEEQELGTTYHRLRHLVFDFVTASVSRTAGRLTLSLAREVRAVKPAATSALSTIRESDGSITSSRRDEGVSRSKIPSLETSTSQWDTPGWLDERLEVEGFCPAIVVHDAETLSDMMFEDEKIGLSVIELTIYTRSKPFAKGGVRLAYYARSAASTSRSVVKSFIRAGHTRADVAEDMRMQALCKAFALEFNGLLKIEPPLDFIVTSCLQKKGVAGGCLSLEPFIEGEYIKYNNNTTWTNEDLADDPFGQMAQAFSHFTFERSWGRFLVNDLQGVGRVLTDPSIQTHDPERFKLNDTNLGDEGFKFFFAAHKCNTYCEQLKLESDGHMLVTGNFKFRERWPVMDPTVCCSNKLCRRIIRLATAHSSDLFPSHKWCNACWSQLQDSMVKCLCTEPGERHEFEVSRFFHESQGEVTPQECPDHREKNPLGFSAAVVGGSLYGKMRATESKGSIAGKSW